MLVGLLLLLAAEPRTTSPAAAAGSARAYGGIAPDGSFPFLGPAQLTRQMDLIAASGARWVRLGVVWSVVEQRRGSFDWSSSDRVIDAARARGLHVLALVTYAPSWASGSDDDKVAPRDPTDIRAFARAAAARYAPRGVHAWEVWNEPNIAAAWAPRPDPVAYTSLLRTVATQVRAVDPRATIVSGGLAPAPDARDGTALGPATFLRRMYDAGAAGSFTAVGLHPYSFPFLPLQAGTASFNAFLRASVIRKVMVDHGDEGKKIWSTEYGAPTGSSGDAVSEQVQADSLVQAYSQLERWSWAGPLFVYTLRDSGTDRRDREQNFGLLHADYSPKPAWTAFRRLMLPAS